MFIKRALPVVLIACATAFTACTSCKSDKNQGPQPTAFETSLQAKDTVQVEQVVATFFDNIKNKKFYDAAGMLYTRNIKGGEIRPMNNEEMDNFVNVYKQLPFEGYMIDYMKFQSNEENEVACSIILMKGRNGLPDAMSKIFFTPVLQGDKWCLILTDSHRLEAPISTFEQRDSLSERYQNYKKTKK